MSGHNRWSKIKGKKLAGDRKRSVGWGKFLREITLTARIGGGDPANNTGLRVAIERARADNMPNDTIQRAIKKGIGELGDLHVEELLYEAYGPGGSAMVIEILTDNRNRTAQEVRSLLDRYNARIGASGSVLYLFKRRGSMAFEAGAVDEEKLLEAALDLGADDVQSGDGVLTVLTDPAAYFAVKEGLEQKGLKPVESGLGFLPDTTVRLDGKVAEAMARLLAALEEHDDVKNVYANAEIDDEIFDRVAGG
ncbi:MAG: YebC/PmpR family DNA-binding transcriptional regulator [Deltaproteobacteria bacterium]|nr:YebC/PmpR family DNA-binding transcriptional regulator [Deltaproteobacteria bacterium]